MKPNRNDGRISGEVNDLRKDRRQLILNHAAALFVERGYAATSMDMLAARMRISKPTLYNYFVSKDALFDQVCDQGRRHLDCLISNSRSSASTPPARVTALIAALATQLVSGERDHFLAIYLIHDDIWSRGEGTPCGDGRMSDQVRALLDDLADIEPFIMALTAFVRQMPRLFCRHCADDAHATAQLVAVALGQQLATHGQSAYSYPETAA